MRNSSSPKNGAKSEIEVKVAEECDDAIDAGGDTKLVLELSSERSLL